MRFIQRWSASSFTIDVGALILLEVDLTSLMQLLLAALVLGPVVQSLLESALQQLEEAVGVCVIVNTAAEWREREGGGWGGGTAFNTYRNRTHQQLLYCAKLGLLLQKAVCRTQSTLATNPARDRH